jgi:predicted hotdog family 3-hydroxylacyl-ACP dehydratase
MQRVRHIHHTVVAAPVPHQGSTCLLDSVQRRSPEEMHCHAVDHTGADHPLRTPSGLLSPVAIQYAAQAMALRRAMRAASDEPPQPGMLAGARQVRVRLARLDDAEGPLQVSANLLAGGSQRALYRFCVGGARGCAFVDGRAALVFETAAGRRLGMAGART